MKIVEFDTAARVKDDKADQWAYRRVLMYLLEDFLKEERLLRVIGRELKAHDPKRQPSLLEWLSWPHMASVWKAGKRKATRPAEDTMDA